MNGGGWLFETDRVILDEPSQSASYRRDRFLPGGSPAGGLRAKAPTRILVALVALITLVVGCSSGGNGAATDTTVAGPTGRVMFVTLGSTDTNGGRDRNLPLAETWPQVLYRTAFPVRAQLVNLARDRSRVADALAQQADDAVALRPRVATVWFGTSDAFAGTDPVQFRRDLALLVDRVKATGADVFIVLGSAPPDAGIDITPYNDQAAAVAHDADVETVDLRSILVTADSQPQIAKAMARAIGPID